MKFEISSFPWKHGYSENFISKEFALKMAEEFPSWNSDIWDKFGKVFDNQNGFKKMLTEQSVMPKSISNFINQLKTQNFIEKIEKAFGMQDLIFDEKLYGGGLFIHPEGSFLQTHLDFNLIMT